MCKSYEKWLLPSRFLTDNDENIYEYSRLPKIQEAIENEKKKYAWLPNFRTKLMKIGTMMKLR